MIVNVSHSALPAKIADGVVKRSVLIVGSSVKWLGISALQVINILLRIIQGLLPVCPFSLRLQTFLPTFECVDVILICFSVCITILGAGILGIVDGCGGQGVDLILYADAPAKRIAVNPVRFFAGKCADSHQYGADEKNAKMFHDILKFC